MYKTSSTNTYQSFLKMTLIHKTGGAVALFLVLVITAGALVLASNAAWLSLGEIESGYTSYKGQEALSAADGCVEEALQRLRYDNSYGVGAGTLSFTLPTGSCTLVITNSGGSMRRIIATGTIGNYNRKLQVDVTASGTTVAITNWQESTA
jgi:hypothetical protein